MSDVEIDLKTFIGNKYKRIAAAVKPITDKLEVKQLKVAMNMSRETLAYTAQVWVYRKAYGTRNNTLRLHICNVMNTGDGGMTMIEELSRNTTPTELDVVLSNMTQAMMSDGCQIVGDKGQASGELAFTYWVDALAADVECAKRVKAQEAKSMRWKRAQVAKSKWRFAFTIVHPDGNRTDCTMVSSKGWKQSAIDEATKQEGHKGKLEGFVFAPIFVDGTEPTIEKCECKRSTGVDGWGDCNYCGGAV